MTHQLTVPDELWERYDGSGMAMRNALYLSSAEEATPDLPPAESVRGNEEPWGTLIITKKTTACPICHASLKWRTLAVYTSWTVQLASGVARGKTMAVHVDCAERAGIEVRWSVTRILADLRYQIQKIKHRKLQRK